MQIGLFELLAAKQSQIEAYRAYIEALQDYWTEQAELERLVGGRLTMLISTKRTDAPHDTPEKGTKGNIHHEHPAKERDSQHH